MKRVALFRLHTDRYPSTDEWPSAILQRPSSAANWNGPYLERKPNDPWKREYKYRHPPAQGLDFDLWSQGPDPQRADDDVTNWQN
jgi:general secretion pathway protein G